MCGPSARDQLTSIHVPHPNTGPLGHPYQLVAACQLSKVYVKASWSLTVTTLIVQKCWHESIHIPISWKQPDPTE